MRIAVLADIHGNLLALQAVLADLADRAVDRVVNLGDCVSGPLWPAETAATLMRLRLSTLRGNHDRWVVATPPAQQFPSDAFARAALSADQLAWLAGLPPALDVADGVVAVHGRPGDDNAYLLETVANGRLGLAAASDIALRLQPVTARVVLCAHSHCPRVVTCGDTLVLNPGSVGQPAYADPTPPAHVAETGSPMARYAILDLAGAPRADLVAVAYDHQAAAACARRNGSPAWAHFLATGYAGPQ